MKIYYLTAARQEYDRQINRLHKNAYTTHSVQDFIADIAALRAEILAHPGLRTIPDFPGFFRSGPSRLHSYRLIYKINKGDIYIVALASPKRKPNYWKNRRGSLD